MARAFIDDDIASFLEVGHSIVIATRNAALDPSATRACGVRVTGRDRVVVLVPKATSAQTLSNLRDNGDIAVCVSSPSNFRTYQLKGRARRVAECTPEDLVFCEEQLRGFGDAIAQYGNSRKLARNLWMFDNVRVEVEVSSIFAQTPGPDAGAAVEAPGDG
jgi:hypothetical protein